MLIVMRMMGLILTCLRTGTVRGGGGEGGAGPRVVQVKGRRVDGLMFAAGARCPLFAGECRRVRIYRGGNDVALSINPPRRS